MVSPGNPYYGIYRYHIGYQYTLLRDFDTKCRKLVYWYLVHIQNLSRLTINNFTKNIIRK